jgi:hypothetical protein
MIILGPILHSQFEKVNECFLRNIFFKMNKI